MPTVSREIVNLYRVILVYFTESRKWYKAYDSGLWEALVYLDFGIYTVLFWLYYFEKLCFCITNCAKILK